MIEKIKLIPKLETDMDVSLKLHKGENPFTVERIISASVRVYEDKEYEMELCSNQIIDNPQVYVNGELVETITSANRVSFLFRDGGKRGLFRDQLGFAQIAIMVTTDSGEEEWYYSELASILIRVSGNDQQDKGQQRQNQKNQDVEKMLEFIYDHQGDLLTDQAIMTSSAEHLGENYDDFASQITLLEDIANVYESSYGYFMANARTKLQPVEVVDRVERLQSIDSKTVQYMSQHPELLHRSLRGVKVGREYYLPNRTLMLQNRTTHDIYENQVVVGFLMKIYGEISQLKKQVSDLLKTFILDGNTNNQEGEYIVSSQIFYKQAIEVLRGYNGRLQELSDRFEQLSLYYNSLWRVTPMEMVMMPEARPIFLAVPQYNRIYMCILKWFGKRGYDFSKEKAMMNFISLPAVFEFYVLAKLVESFKKKGFSLLRAEYADYALSENSLYQNKECRNTFEFKKEDYVITLYYSPVIYCYERNNDKGIINGIALYRNNSIPLPSDNDVERRGRYYTPDYLFKVSRYNKDTCVKEKYVICDAKYRTYNNVRYEEVPKLSYKYLFSLGQRDPKAALEGMILFYGIPGEKPHEKKVMSFYDKAMNWDLRPFVDMMPMSENFEEADQDSNFTMLLRLLQQDMEP